MIVTHTKTERVNDLNSFIYSKIASNLDFFDATDIVRSVPKKMGDQFDVEQLVNKSLSSYVSCGLLSKSVYGYKVI